MKKLNVLFLWKIEKALKTHLQNMLSSKRNINLVFPGRFSESNLLKLAGDANVMIGWKPTRELLAAAKNLMLFVNPGTGVKHQIELFRSLTAEKEVVLVNGHGHAYATAQHAVALLLALMNRIIPHHEWMKNGIWRTSDNKDIFSASLPLRNRKIGLLGYGAINKNVHKFLSGFDNQFHILKRKWKKNDLKKNMHYYEPESLHDFMKAIDILIIALPHTARTEDMIKMSELKLLGNEGLLVNVARGKIVREKDLYDALNKKIIKGAAIDVWYNYTPKKDRSGKEFPFDYPFQKLGNIVMSPHRAASPFDDLNRWDEVIENLKRAAAGSKDFLNVVDLKEEY